MFPRSRSVPHGSVGRSHFISPLKQFVAALFVGLIAFSSVDGTMRVEVERPPQEREIEQPHSIREPNDVKHRQFDPSLDERLQHRGLRARLRDPIRSNMSNALWSENNWEGRTKSVIGA